MRNVHKALTFLGSWPSRGGAGSRVREHRRGLRAHRRALPGQTPQVASSTGTSGSDSGALCDQHPKDNPGAISDDCGVFVKSGVARGEGTKASPLGTVQARIAKATSSRRSASTRASVRSPRPCRCRRDVALRRPRLRQGLGGDGSALDAEGYGRQGPAVTLQGDGNPRRASRRGTFRRSTRWPRAGAPSRPSRRTRPIVRFESSSLTAGRGSNGPGRRERELDGAACSRQVGQRKPPRA
jgi:hypothetical protein